VEEIERLVERTREVLGQLSDGLSRMAEIQGEIILIVEARRLLAKRDVGGGELSSDQDYEGEGRRIE